MVATGCDGRTNAAVANELGASGCVVTLDEHDGPAVGQLIGEIVAKHAQVNTIMTQESAAVRTSSRWIRGQARDD